MTPDELLADPDQAIIHLTCEAVRQHRDIAVNDALDVVRAKLTELGAAPSFAAVASARQAARRVCAEMKVADLASLGDEPLIGESDPAESEPEEPDESTLASVAVASGVTPMPRRIPFDLATEPGLLGDIARWSQTFAYRPVKDFAAPAAIGFLATLFGRRWLTPTGLGLNLYLIAIATTGQGKDALLGCPKELLKAAGLRRFMGPTDFTGYGAILSSMKLHPNQLMTLDEFGKLAQAIRGFQSPANLKLAGKALLEIYGSSGPGGEWGGMQYSLANADKKLSAENDASENPVRSPTLSVVGVSTPKGLFEGLSEGDFEAGMVNRFTVFKPTALPNEVNKDPSRTRPPAQLIAAIQRAAPVVRERKGNVSELGKPAYMVEPNFAIATWTDEAEAAFDEIQAWQFREEDAGRSGSSARAAAQCQKMATIRALGRDHVNPIITAEDMYWAFDIVCNSIEAIEAGAREMMSSGPFEKCCMTILANVATYEAAHGKGIKASDLGRSKGMKEFPPTLYEGALKRLVKDEELWDGAMGGRYRIRRADERDQRP